ncbi:pca operon transcription factor PcaQ [Oceanicella sp. SM1341]|uniref:pca operon transcription factor PcaQ n=1 Tax=Oceanicella sp. SM1341 TaxID=1548889 RepID=UPI000E51A797|nr:pca operon transcription factor PcaQ [Oceanicella sp. SM1341]
MNLDARLRLRHLRCFEEIARLGSVGQAAEILHISQPAASKTLRELEEMLDVTLFDRSGRRLRLTRAGLRFREHAGAALSSLRQGVAVVTGKPRKPMLRLGVLPTVATGVMPKAALSFSQSHPQVQLRVSTAPNWFLLEQLRTHALDMVVGRLAAPEQMTGLVFEHLYSEQIAAVVRPGHPLALSGDIGALADYPLILPPPGAVIRTTVEQFLLARGLGGLQARYESVSLAFGRAVVRESDAVWLISRGVVEEELSLGRLVAIGPGGEDWTGPVGLSLRGNETPTEELHALIEEVRRVCEGRRLAGIDPD